MAANELPEKPSNEDFAIARRRVAPGLHQASIRDHQRARAVLRYLLAQHDAKPAPVAVPEDVLRDAREVMAQEAIHTPRTVRFARFALSLVPEPEPVVEWRKNLTGDKNTAWQLYVNGDYRTEVGHCLRHDAPAWRLETGFVGERAVEFYSKLDNAKARAEELCGISSKKGG